MRWWRDRYDESKKRKERREEEEEEEEFPRISEKSRVRKNDRF